MLIKLIKALILFNEYCQHEDIKEKYEGKNILVFENGVINVLIQADEIQEIDKTGIDRLKTLGFNTQPWGGFSNNSFGGENDK